jgi:HD-like signal output (HDOD) protein
MNTKSILLAVADREALADITQALGDGWKSTSVSNEADALAHLERHAFDVLLVDFNLGSPDTTSELLNQALEKRPETIRFLLAYEADLALVAAYVSGPHEIIPKPVEIASLKSRIECGVFPQDSNRNQSGGDPATVASDSPAVPAIYAEVLKALDFPGVTKSQVGEIIARDEALTSEVLRLIKSACPGLPRSITDPVEAVEAMGLETVKALVMALRFLAEHSQLKPGYLSLDKIWEHSTHVAQLARDLMLFETKDRALAGEALAAGLLHDLGKVVLASNFDDLYGRVHSLARNQPVALWDIEKEMFGANHGEIGGCLVGMWNMPSSVVQAVALHHEPPVGEDQQLTPLAAVHIANVLEHQIRQSDEFRVAPVMSMAFLNDLGLLQRLPVWRAVFANRRDTNAGPEVESAETSQPRLIIPGFSDTPAPFIAKQPPAPATATSTATSGEPGSEDGMPVAPSSYQSRWVYAGAAAAVLGFLALWLGTRTPLAVRARTPGSIPNLSPVVMSPSPATESAPTVVTEATPALAVSEEASATNTVLVPNPAATILESGPTVATAPHEMTAKSPPPTLTTELKAQPGFRLNGIIFTVARPAAIVNGQTVYVGDRVSGATVAAIDRTNVTLQVNGRKTCVFLPGTD